MTRETKLNLVFLVVICGLTLPGAALLFKKKLDPAEPPMYLPHPVRKSIAFNDPRFAPPQVERVYGPVTRNWIAGLAGADSLDAGHDAPIMSQQRTFQVVSTARDGDDLEVRLLVWRPDAVSSAAPLDWTVQLSSDAEPGRPTTDLTFTTVEVPQGVRAELQRVGYVRPPATVQLLTARFDMGEDAARDLRVVLSAAGSDAGFTESAPLPEDIPDPKPGGHADSSHPR